jgi:Zn-dependent M28 family amino/carboxypeptidase
MATGDLSLYLRGRLNQAVARLQNRRSAIPRPTPLPTNELLEECPSPFKYVRWLEGRSNIDRQLLVGHYLEAKKYPLTRAPYHSFEGEGENFVVDVGGGGPLLILIAHHDAVPGSPGANDNASGIGILLHLLHTLWEDPPQRLRVKFLFTGDEELGYLGARGYVKMTPLPETLGVLSLELCGIGDSLAVWDVLPEFADAMFLKVLASAWEALGYRRNETYHLVGRIPVFGSDHRAFAAKGIPAFGLTLLPSHEADRLREFIFKPLRPSLLLPRKRPVPFDTYHTANDRSEHLDPEAMLKVCDALLALIESLDRRA